MDPSIMKILEEDEDESMHSGADVDAFQAALNRDIGGDVSTSQPSDSGTAVYSQESNQSYGQVHPNWQTTTQEENISGTSQQNVQQQQQQQEQPSSMVELNRHVSAAESQQQQQDISLEPNVHLLHQMQPNDTPQQVKEQQIPIQTPQTAGIQMSEKSSVTVSETEKQQNSDFDSQFLKLQKAGSQQTTGMEQAGNQKPQSKQIPFGLLLPALKPHLDKDREMQLTTLFTKLRKNEIPKDQFVRLMRSIVGDQVLRSAVQLLQTQVASNQSQLQSQVLARQHQTDSSHLAVENNAQKAREMEHQPDSHVMQTNQIPTSTTGTVNQERDRSSISTSGHNIQQQQHLHFPQSSFSIYGGSGGNYRPYSGTNVNTSASSVKPQPHDKQMRPMSHHQNVVTTQLGGSNQAMSMINGPKFERQTSLNDANKVQGNTVSRYTNKSGLQQTAAPWQASTNKEQSSASFSSINYVKPEPVDVTTEQHKSQFSNPQGMSANTNIEQGSSISASIKEDSLPQSSKIGFGAPPISMPTNTIPPSITTQLDPNVQVGSRMTPVASSSGVNIRTPPKKPTVGQKKPLEGPVSSPPMPSKKQKVGALLDQSIEQLNDVTAVSGVNLREEEEQLLTGPKEESRASEASRRVVQEEEERLIFYKTALQKKLAEIMVKFGLKNIGADVERCLSLSVEERMRGLIANLIRLSKQRVDAEKPRHRTIITSDIQQQIMAMNRKAREEWEKKQAEAEKLRKANDPESDDKAEGDKEKDEGRSKAVKANKEEDDKMRTTAANVAARAAVGVDDMLSKWQLMAEQARQKREGGTDTVSGSQSAKDSNRKPQSTSGRNLKDNQDVEKRTTSASANASGAFRKRGRNQAIVPPIRVARTISIKDVIGVLEREPQMSKSTLIYQLYERIRSDSSAE
ncbi:hypothetical protein K2173_012942 [Erythroxylum novogranatense]|uniref:RST domain-containing protein n=1 Tax=Erythroxylum novogranatense TaxID=1862640 RepID=A0AAV8S5M2_9ROSI|nr:hypothetical protein K2173_012942 [Erythroxylum novogranatense]